jgi:hypothetical protein
MINNSIKANELRIGNWINFTPDNGNFIISDIKTFNENTINGLELEDCQPIPLTDEWFEKWGFHKDGEYWSMGIFDYKYCFKYRDWANNWAFYQEYTDSPDPSDDGKKYPISFDIQYVHQLQNIWFALLHEEISQ